MLWLMKVGGTERNIPVLNRGFNCAVSAEIMFYFNRDSRAGTQYFLFHLYCCLLRK